MAPMQLAGKKPAQCEKSSALIGVLPILVVGIIALQAAAPSSNLVLVVWRGDTPWVIWNLRPHGATRCIMASATISCACAWVRAP